MTPPPRSSSSKVVVVTGAANGIGAATTEALRARGARVVAVDRDKSILATAGEGLEAMVGDVADPVQVEHAVALAVERFGRLDAMFNNAGIRGEPSTIEAGSIDELARVYATNVGGVFLGIKRAVPAIRDSGGGAILNTASTGAFRGAAELGPYVASKHAVLGLTRTAAVELADEGIAVNALCPGATATEMTPLTELRATVAGAELVNRVSPTGRLAEPQEVGDVAAWLLLDAPAYLTGSVIAVDGAHLAQAPGAPRRRDVAPEPPSGESGGR